MFAFYPVSSVKWASNVSISLVPLDSISASPVDYIRIKPQTCRRGKRITAASAHRKMKCRR